jgi:hypothetical protein
MEVEYRDLYGELLFTEKWRVDLNSGLLDGPDLKKVLQDKSLYFREPAANVESAKDWDVRSTAARA